MCLDRSCKPGFEEEQVELEQCPCGEEVQRSMLVREPRDEIGTEKSAKNRLLIVLHLCILPNRCR